MTNTTNALKSRVLDRDDDLRDVLGVLLQNAIRRQMWLLFMDPNGCLGDPIMPMADYPDDPSAVIEIDDLGSVTQAQLLMHRVNTMRVATGNSAVVLAWERPGTHAVFPEDQAWAHAMAEAAQALDVPLRAQFIVHSRGVRQLHPDDYL